MPILDLPLAPRPMTLDFTGTMPNNLSLNPESFKITIEARKIHRWQIISHHGDSVPTLYFHELDEDGFEVCRKTCRVYFNYDKHFNEIGQLVGEAWSKALNPWLSLNDALHKGLNVKGINDWLVCYPDWRPPRLIRNFENRPFLIEKVEDGYNVGFMPVPWATPDVLEACKRIEVYKGDDA